MNCEKAIRVDIDTPKVLGSWTQIVLDAVRDSGLDTRELLDAVGLDVDEPLAPNSRLSAHVISDLWRCAARTSDNPSIGIDAVRYVSTTTYQALGYSVFASSTLRKAFQRYARFGRIVISNARLQVTKEGAQTHLIFDMASGYERLADEAIDAVIAQAVQTARNLAASRVSPVSVSLRRPEPDHKQPFEDFFSAPILFSAKTDALVFDSELLDRPLPYGNELLAKQADDVAERTMHSIDRESQATPTSDGVRQWLVHQLDSGEPTQIGASKAMGMSLRSLQRRISDEGGSFRKLTKQVRIDLSRKHLLDDSLTIQEISTLVGFSGSSSFSQAFRRWTGMSPTAFRDATKIKKLHRIGTSQRHSEADRNLMRVFLSTIDKRCSHD